MSNARREAEGRPLRGGGPGPSVARSGWQAQVQRSVAGLPYAEQVRLLRPAPVQMEEGDGTDAGPVSLKDKSYAERMKALGDSKGTMPTYVAFTTTDPAPNPSQGQTFWDTLGNPGSWVSERAAIHQSIAKKAKDQAKNFDKEMASSGARPTIYAMRGNTAAGKSRAIQGNVPELKDKTKKEEPHRAINPDNFKTDLFGVTPVPVSSSQIHHESSTISWAVKQEIMGATREGTEQKGSVLVDERLIDPGSIAALVREAKSSNRQLNVYDVDAPLETSLYGVLLRPPGGSDPIPPFDVIAQGFMGARQNRAALIEQYLSDPTLGKYELYAANPDGTRVQVASIDGTSVSVADAALYDELVTNPAKKSEELKQLVETLKTTVIDDGVIARITAPLSPSFGPVVAEALAKYKGKTFGAAVGEASMALSTPPEGEK